MSESDCVCRGSKGKWLAFGISDNQRWEPCPECAVSKKPAPERSAYHREVPTTSPKCGERHAVTIDVYIILHIFGVTAQTIAHAIKKLLMPGQRLGGKSMDQDVSEAIWSLRRWEEIRAAEAAKELP